MVLFPTTVIAEPAVTAPVAVEVPLANCWEYVKRQIPTLPNTKDLKPNSTPQKGAVVIFEYPGNLMHYAVLTTFDGDGFWVDENNYKAGVTAPRWVRFNDPAIRGFWVPPTSPDGVN